MAWLDDVPAHWEVSRLKSLVDNKTELTAGSDNSNQACITMEQVEGWTGRIKHPSNITQLDSQVKQFRVGDVLFGKLRPYLAKVARPSFDGVCVGEFLVLRAIRPELSEQYLELTLRSTQAISYVNSMAVGARMPRVEWNSIGLLPFPLPPLSEQGAIVRYLDYVDARIRRYVRAKRRLIELLTEQKQALIHRAVTGRVDVRTGEPYAAYKPSGVEWLGDVPAHWEVWAIGHFAKVGNGSTPSRGNTDYWYGGTYPWLNSSCVHRQIVNSADQFVTPLALRECHLPEVPPGSILVAITGQGKTRGTAAILDMEATINQHMAYITPRSSSVSSDYLQMYLTAAYSELRRISDDSGSTKGALTCEDVKRFPVALPPFEEQFHVVCKIRQELSRGEDAVRRIRQEIDLMREYRTRLIADVVTGKLDVREAAARLPAAEEEREAFEETEWDEEASVAEDFETMEDEVLAEDA